MMPQTFTTAGLDVYSGVPAVWPTQAAAEKRVTVLRERYGVWTSFQARAEGFVLLHDPELRQDDNVVIARELALAS